jgi:preprotein translocase subunit SecE
VARDRKRAKQRRERRSAAGRAAAGSADTPATGGADTPTTGGANGAPAEPVLDAPNGAPPEPAPGTIERADVPAALDHASAEVDEFDAAIVRGAGGVSADAEHLSEGEIEAEALSEGDLSQDELQEPAGTAVRRRPGGGGADGGVTAEQASGAPIRKGNRAIAFLRASWAELQRVQWPDRRQVFQATAVVLGFVAIAGAYLGLADYVAKEIVDFIL